MSRRTYAHVTYTYERVVRVEITPELARIYQDQYMRRAHGDDEHVPVLDADSAIEAAAHPASRLFLTHVPDEGLIASDYRISILPSE